MTRGRPTTNGSRQGAQYRLPPDLDAFVAQRAAQLGTSKAQALILLLLDIQAAGPADLRSVQHKAEAADLRRKLLEMARDINALADREAAARKRAAELAYAYGVLARTVRRPGSKLRETISHTIARLDGEFVQHKFPEPRKTGHPPSAQGSEP